MDNVHMGTNTGGNEITMRHGLSFSIVLMLSACGQIQDGRDQFQLEPDAEAMETKEGEINELNKSIANYRGRLGESLSEGDRSSADAYLKRLDDRESRLAELTGVDVAEIHTPTQRIIDRSTQDKTGEMELPTQLLR
jgi:hypothetical protein